jgi:predicted nucleic acid-binding Zn ribbon protein
VPRERERQSLVLSEILKRALPPEARRRIYSIELVERRWASVVGDEIARRSEPEALVDGVLTVRVTDPVWGKTITRLSSRIVPELNRAVGMKLVKRINFTRRERLENEAANTPPARRARPSATAPEGVVRAASTIENTELRALVTESAARYFQAQQGRKRR